VDPFERSIKAQHRDDHDDDVHATAIDGDKRSFRDATIVSGKIKQ
jgi:hypothetical protein